MRRRPPRPGDGRAIIAVVALYALLLQAFLGVAAPAPAFDPAGAVWCADHASGAPADDAARTDCHPCCTAVQAVALAAPPAAASAASWPHAASLRAVWRPEADIPPTGPPARAGRIRGPPAA